MKAKLVVRTLAGLLTMGAAGCTYWQNIVKRSELGNFGACVERLPDYSAAATCLGAEAATVGFRAALDEAVQALRRAQVAEGADDRMSAAAELELALERLARECGR